MALAGFWDIHNHILPGIDDGSSCVEESLDLLRQEYEQGVRNIICTPHFRSGMFTVPAGSREEVFLEFKEEASRVFPKVQLMLGCELYVGRETDGISDHMRTRMEDYRYRMDGGSCILLEFSTDSELRTIRSVTRECAEAGLVPIIAHAERYNSLYKDAEGSAKKLRKDGAFIQINADTFLEGMFSKRRKFAKTLMEHGLVDLIASDAHNTSVRSVHIGECAAYIEKHYGKDKVRKIFVKNPARLFGAEQNASN